MSSVASLKGQLDAIPAQLISISILPNAFKLTSMPFVAVFLSVKSPATKVHFEIVKVYTFL